MTVVFLNCVLGNREGTNDSLYKQMRIVPLLAEKYFLCFRNQRLVSFFQNCWDLLQKKNVLWLRKTFELRSWRPRICNSFEITRTIYSKSEMPGQFLKQNAFLTCSCRSFRPYISEKKYWDPETFYLCYLLCLIILTFTISMHCYEKKVIEKTHIIN